MILPRWLMRAGWAIHKGLFRLTGGRVGLEEPTSTKVGTLRLRTRGRRSGEPRANFVFYIEDGDSLVIVASNAGDDRVPAWWLNLQSQPDSEVDLVGGSRPVRARVADPEERSRLWQRLVDLQPRYAEYEVASDRPIDVVILEPR